MSRHYILTLSANKSVFAPYVLPDGISYMKGQLEQGAGGLVHWQFVVASEKKSRISGIKKIWPAAHIEVTRSAAVDDYVWKDETSLGCRFELVSTRGRQRDPLENIYLITPLITPRRAKRS